MKILLILFALFAVETFAACSAPIERTNSSANTVLTSSKYNTDLNTAYTKVNDLDGDCITDTSIATAKLENASVTKAKLATDARDQTIISKTATYLVTSTDDTVLVDATAGAVTLNLPTAVGISGRKFIFKKTDSTVNKVILDGNSAETIDGVTTKELTYQYQVLEIISNGANWLIVAQVTVDFKTCYYFFGGASATLAAPTECTAGTCVEVYDSCNSATPPSGASALYTDLTYAAGTWANSSPLFCTASASDVVTGTPAKAVMYFATGDQTQSTTASGGAVLNVAAFNAATGAVSNSYLQVECKGVAP